MSENQMVSIIMPVYNNAQFIIQSIESVFNQFYRNWELIIVDDSSVDDSFQIAQSFAIKDARISVFKLENNQGPAVARNYAIERAKGRFMAFLDSDDIWYPEKLEKQIEFMLSNEYAFTYSYYEKITENGDKMGILVKSPKKLSYKDMLKSNQIGCLTAIYDTKYLGKQYMPNIRKRQDYGLWLKILKEIPYACCYKEPLAYYRMRSVSVSSNKLGLLKYNWRLFREVEKLSLPGSVYYLGWNILRKIIK